MRVMMIGALLALGTGCMLTVDLPTASEDGVSEDTREPDTVETDDPEALPEKAEEVAHAACVLQLDEDAEPNACTACAAEVCCDTWNDSRESYVGRCLSLCRYEEGAPLDLCVQICGTPDAGFTDLLVCIEAGCGSCG